MYSKIYTDRIFVLDMLSCDLCRKQKDAEEFLFCKICRKLLCALCEVTEHGSLKHQRQTFRWDTLEAVGCVDYLNKLKQIREKFNEEQTENGIKLIEEVCDKLKSALTSQFEQDTKNDAEAISGAAETLLALYRLPDEESGTNTRHLKFERNEDRMNHVVNQALTLAGVEALQPEVFTKSKLVGFDISVAEVCSLLWQHAVFVDVKEEELVESKSANELTANQEC